MISFSIMAVQDRCMRLLPHQQDTGGFFVAVLEKKKLCPWESVRKAEYNSTEGAENTEYANGTIYCHL